VHSILCDIIDDCSLVIVGGSTAALGAAISASTKLDQRVCLLEPTDWAGGQLTSELLSAPDFAYHKITDKDTNFTLDVGTINRQANNQNLLFRQMITTLGNTGRCWVSLYCSIPDQFLSRVIQPLIGNIRIYYNTVIKQIIKDESGRRIIQIDAIQRTPRASSDEYCRFLSEELPDWYSPDESPWFSKTSLSFRNISFVVEGTSWGEVLVLANASYLQGLMEQFDGDISGVGNATCGQSFTFDFLEQLHETSVDEPSNPLPEPTGGGNYSLLGYEWERIWTYRRVNTSTTSAFVAVNDLTIQNWDRGNDYGRDYFYLPVADAHQQRDTNQWQGGVNINAIREAERQAYGYHYWYRAKAPTNWANRTVLVRSVSTAGTCHGLAKMPYLRESRRSIGINNFLLNISMISGNARDIHGYIPHDRLCLGAYNVDIHSMSQCKYPAYIYQYYPVLPYYVPLRAMTNRDIDNLFVIGKTMAQTFLVNSATRLHPVEFSSGQAAGIASAYAIQSNIGNVGDLMQDEHLRQIQALVISITPISWTINGTQYPDDSASSPSFSTSTTPSTTIASHSSSPIFSLSLPIFFLTMFFSIF
ncbi:unnamed protein product, partial [Rotaria sordida]